jgi:alpha-galactosidase
MLGMSLTDNDDWTLGLITNDEVIAINQDPLGQAARRVVKNPDKTEIWVRDLAKGAKAVGMINRGDAAAPVSIDRTTAGLSGAWTARDVWGREDLGRLDDNFSRTVPKHGSVLLLLKPAP